jgi:hypothetical protein
MAQHLEDEQQIVLNALPLGFEYVLDERVVGGKIVFMVETRKVPLWKEWLEELTGISFVGLLGLIWMLSNFRKRYKEEVAGKHADVQQKHKEVVELTVLTSKLRKEIDALKTQPGNQ